MDAIWIEYIQNMRCRNAITINLHIVDVSVVKLTLESQHKARSASQNLLQTHLLLLEGPNFCFSQLQYTSDKDSWQHELLNVHGPRVSNKYWYQSMCQGLQWTWDVFIGTPLVWWLSEWDQLVPNFLHEINFC